MSLLNIVRAARARSRLRMHMYDRLMMGGTPDCPCSRCANDLTLLRELGEEWDDPTKAAWWRDFERTLDRAKDGGER